MVDTSDKDEKDSIIEEMNFLASPIAFNSVVYDALKTLLSKIEAIEQKIDRLNSESNNLQGEESQ